MKKDPHLIKEDYLLDLLDEAKRLIVARNVVREQGIQRYQVPTGADNRHLASDAGDVLHDALAARLLTALMLVIGYRIPTGLYSLGDYVQLCDWLGAKEEDGGQRWEDC